MHKGKHAQMHIWQPKVKSTLLEVRSKCSGSVNEGIFSKNLKVYNQMKTKSEDFWQFYSKLPQPRPSLQSKEHGLSVIPSFPLWKQGVACGT